MRVICTYLIEFLSDSYISWGRACLRSAQVVFFSWMAVWEEKKHWYYPSLLSESLCGFAALDFPFFFLILLWWSYSLSSGFIQADSPGMIFCLIRGWNQHYSGVIKLMSSLNRPVSSTCRQRVCIKGYTSDWDHRGRHVGFQEDLSQEKRNSIFSVLS